MLSIKSLRAKLSLYILENTSPDQDSFILKRTQTQLAEYFGVTTDYLLGQDDSQSASKNEENKKPADLKKILENQQVMFDGEVVTEEDKELINKMLEKMYWTAKEKNKRKKY